MSERRVVRILIACLSLLVTGSLFAGEIPRVDPAAVAALPSGELLIIDGPRGIMKVSGAAKTSLIRNFGIFEATDLTGVRLADSDAFFVTLRLAQAKEASFAHLSQRAANGREVNQWKLPIPGGVLAGVAIDPVRQIAYCSDSHYGVIYKLDLRSRARSFETLIRVRDPGILGPLVLDAKRQRLIVADVKRGRILAISLDGKRTDVLQGEGTIREPLALALDPATERLFIADSTKGRVWVGSVAGARLAPKTFSTYRFRDPIGVTWSKGTLWVIDGETRRLSQFSADGTPLKHIPM